MAIPYKTCPICGSQNHPNASICINCGTTLGSTDPTKPRSKLAENTKVQYDFRYGETDLYEVDLQPTVRSYFLGAIITLLLALMAVSMVALGALLFKLPRPSAGSGTAQVGSATVRPTIALSTVTAGPPTATYTATLPPSETATITPTLQPCTRQVQPGDDLITLAFQCGHRSLDVIPLILELNDLTDPAMIRAGETVLIPWPTATVDPNTLPTETPESGSGAEAVVGGESTALSAEVATLDPLAPPPTKTLQPGVTWHQVSQGETISSIALQYGANVEILSQLNPEVQFSQCDFGAIFGGDSCIVQLYVGQLVRVPAATPTPTIPPTSSGSETPTPTATATFNAPSALNPDDRAFFAREELVTLRWVATGTLAPGQVYHVMVENLATGETFSADTKELSFLIPPEWQAKGERRFEYRWHITVIDAGNPDRPYQTTDARTFTWEGN